MAYIKGKEILFSSKVNIRYGGASLGTKLITTNGTFDAVDEGYDGYSTVTVVVKNSSGGGGEQPTLNTPNLTVDNYNAMLTITDDENGNFVDYYSLYYAGKYVGATTEKTVDLLGVTAFKGDGNIDVIASGELFNDSNAGTVIWEQPRLYSPVILLDNVTSTLVIVDRNGSKTVGYNIYTDGAFLAFVTDTTVTLSDYVQITETKTVTVKAVSGDAYYLDSDFSNAVAWYTLVGGTDGLTYELLSDGTYACTGRGTSTESEIIIATVYNGAIVSTVANFAFQDDYSITKVVIPDSIHTIGRSAFANCRYLEDLTIGEGVTNIGTKAFYYAYRLQTIRFNAVCCEDLVVKNDAFQRAGGGNTDFKNDGCDFIVGKNVTRIPANLFDCTINPAYFSSLVFEKPSVCTSIGANGFYHINGLKSLTIPAIVKNIGRYAFQELSAIEEIIFEGTPDTIDQAAFYQANGVMNVNIYVPWAESESKGEPWGIANYANPVIHYNHTT